MRFDESKKTKFSTFLGNEARWICLNQFNRNKHRRESTPLDVLINTLSSEDEKKSLTDRDILDKIFKLTKQSKDERVHKIFQSRYQYHTENKLTPWSIVSKKNNISNKGTNNLVDAGWGIGSPVRLITLRMSVRFRPPQPFENKKKVKEEGKESGIYHGV